MKRPYTPKPVIKAKALTCQRCGFQAKHPCQIDVHHKDGNPSNNAPENRESICANCYRLEHFANPDPKYSRKYAPPRPPPFPPQPPAGPVVPPWKSKS